MKDKKNGSFLESVDVSEYDVLDAYERVQNIILLNKYNRIVDFISYFSIIILVAVIACFFEVFISNAIAKVVVIAVSTAIVLERFIYTRNNMFITRFMKIEDGGVDYLMESLLIRKLHEFYNLKTEVIRLNDVIRLRYFLAEMQLDLTRLKIKKEK